MDHAHWMEDRLGTLGDRSLKQLVLPASHDAAMYLTSFPQSLGRTQNLSIYGQLHEGVRYFDLRPAWRDGTICMHHDFILGPTLAQVLDDVRRYMSNGHRELVILKFSHYDKINAEHYNTAVGQIESELGPWLYKSRSAQRLADIPLRDYLSAHGTVLVFFEGSFPARYSAPGIWVYRDWDNSDPAIGDLRVYDQYSNVTSYPVMKSDQFAKFDRYDGKCKIRPDVPCDLFLLSWTLTPPTNVPTYAKEPNEHLADDMATLKIPNRFGCMVNLLYADCVETAHLTDAAIRLNESLYQSRGVPPRTGPARSGSAEGIGASFHFPP